MADRAPARPDAAPTLDLRIEELVLHGFERIDRHQVASAIEHELARLLREPAAHEALRRHGATDGRGEADRMDAGAFILPHDASALAVGVQVAHAIWRGMAPSGAPGGDAARGSQRAQPPQTGGGG
jgi:hypothetical protein